MGSSTDNVLVNTNERIIYLSDLIDNKSIGIICFNLLCMIQADYKEESEKKNYIRKPIRIYINSDGGNVYDMWALVDIIEKSKTPIYTYCTGYAMSAAFIIFLAGHKRFATKHATFLYHQISFWRSGKYQDLIEEKDELDYLQSEVEKYVIEHTNFLQQDLEKIRLMKQDIYLHANEALEFGIVNEILK